METVTYQGREVRWAATPRDWDRAVSVARAAGIVGWDSEFHGVNLRERSPARAAVVDVWSLAVPNGVMHPRGHQMADGLVLPAEALHHPGFRDLLEDPSFPKVAHNARSEYHAADNSAGVVAAGVLDSLEYFRWIYPERVSLPGQPYGLKEGAPLIGRVPLGEYKVLFSEPNMVEVRRHRKTRVCSCGEPGCRKRLGHERVDRVEEWSEWVQRGERLIPLETIREGHPKWDLLRVYAAEDAVFALELLFHLRRVGARRTVEVPWLRQEAT